MMARPRSRFTSRYLSIAGRVNSASENETKRSVSRCGEKDCSAGRSQTRRERTRANLTIESFFFPFSSPRRIVKGPRPAD